MELTEFIHSKFSVPLAAPFVQSFCCPHHGPVSGEVGLESISLSIVRYAILRKHLLKRSKTDLANVNLERPAIF